MRIVWVSRIAKVDRILKEAVLKNTIDFELQRGDPLRAVRANDLLLRSSVARVVLGHSLGSFGNSVFGQLSRKNQSDSGLNFARCDCVSFVVSGEFSSFVGESLKDVVDEVVHNDHGLSGDT
jgi:hypothetical protein